MKAACPSYAYSIPINLTGFMKGHERIFGTEVE